MIRAKLMDGQILEIAREEAIELLPYRAIFTSPLMKAPLEGVLLHRGALLPLLGPLPSTQSSPRPAADEQAWVLLMKGCAQVIKGLPEFLEAAAEENSDAELDAILNEAT